MVGKLWLLAAMVATTGVVFNVSVCLSVCFNKPKISSGDETQIGTCLCVCAYVCCAESAVVVSTVRRRCKR